MYVIDILACSLIGFFVGLSELANRYRSFGRLLYDKNSWLYMLINALAAALVFYLVDQYKVDLGSLGAHTSGKVIFCGLGAMAFLRSSFFSYKDSNGKVIEVGPAALLSIFLKVTETRFDQEMSNANIKAVQPIMENLNFVSASKDLPMLILASMRILSSDEQKSLSDEVTRLMNDESASMPIKNTTLGLILLKYCGLELLKSSAETIRNNRGNWGHIEELK
ncbi:MAG TPA: hypothetical protein PLX35_16450 [Cyclobacteriaceae bacterium]|nr:hypothetical protein [Cyclobacteriaceae bacterium]